MRQRLRSEGVREQGRVSACVPREVQIARHERHPEVHGFHVRRRERLEERREKHHGRPPIEIGQLHVRYAPNELHRDP